MHTKGHPGFPCKQRLALPKIALSLKLRIQQKTGLTI